MPRLDDPDVVAREYATLDRFAQRRLARTADVGGASPWLVALDAITEAGPARVLDAGCGTAEFAALITAPTVVCVDLSPAAARAARTRGMSSAMMNLQHLALRDGAFDVVVCNWVLYHVPDRGRAIGELARVLRAGGRLVGAYNSSEHLRELWSAVGDPWRDKMSFPCENAEAHLRPHFSRIELRPVTGEAIWRTRDDLQRYLDAYRELAGPLTAPQGPYPFRATRRNCVIVADR
jgi:SAM-dependent methyltransferase